VASARDRKVMIGDAPSFVGDGASAGDSAHADAGVDASQGFLVKYADVLDGAPSVLDYLRNPRNLQLFVGCLPSLATTAGSQMVSRFTFTNLLAQDRLLKKVSLSLSVSLCSRGHRCAVFVQGNQPLKHLFSPPVSIGPCA
jgi:hypothetical protein